jgi:transcriptional regulator with XRE-family HTH domain
MRETYGESREVRLPNIFTEIGKQIRELRLGFAGKGISQAELARHMGTTPNTISRWETGVYKPSVTDLENLARFFGVPIAQIFPEPIPTPLPKELSIAIEGLNTADLQEVVTYARYRRAISTLKVGNTE